jgi:cell division septation protein DedD
VAPPDFAACQPKTLRRCGSHFYRADAFQTFVAKKVRTVQPACGRPDGVFWESVDQAWEVLLGSAERDGNDIVVKVANNRSYGLLVGYDIAARSHSIELPSASMGLVQAYSILMKIEAWALREQANVAAALAGSSPVGGIIYLPPGAMVTLRSSSWEGAKNIIAGPAQVTLAMDHLLAVVDVLRLLSIKALGVDPWSSMGALTDLDLALKCTSGAPYALVSSSLKPMWPCLLSELKRVMPQLGLNVLATLIGAMEAIADLGNRLTPMVEARWDAFTFKWPAYVKVTVARPAPTSTPQVTAAPSPTPARPAPTPTPRVTAAPTPTPARPAPTPTPQATGAPTPTPAQAGRGPCGSEPRLSEVTQEQLVKVVKPTGGPVEAYEVWESRYLPFNQTSTWISICGLRLPANVYAPFDGVFTVAWDSVGAAPSGASFDNGVQAVYLFLGRGPLDQYVDVRCPAARSEKFHGIHPGVGQPYISVMLRCDEVRAGQLVAVLPRVQRPEWIAAEVRGASIDDLIRYLQLIFR